jgi:hypothetical protein
MKQVWWPLLMAIHLCQSCALSPPIPAEAIHIISESRSRAFRSELVASKEALTRRQIQKSLEYFVARRCQPPVRLAQFTIAENFDVAREFHWTSMNPEALYKQVRAIHQDAKADAAATRQTIGSVLCVGTRATGWIQIAAGGRVEQLAIRGPQPADLVQTSSGVTYTISSLLVDGPSPPYPHLYLTGPVDRHHAEELMEVINLLIPEQSEPEGMLVVRQDHWFGFQGGAKLNYLKAPAAVYSETEHIAPVLVYSRHPGRPALSRGVTNEEVVRITRARGPNFLQ